MLVSGNMKRNLVLFLFLTGVVLAMMTSATPTHKATGTRTLACESTDDCKSACGKGVTKFKCHSQGFCSCVGKKMPADRCKPLRAKDMKCQMHCDTMKHSVSRRCETKTGGVCSCFVYSEA